MLIKNCNLIRIDCKKNATLTIHSIQNAFPVSTKKDLKIIHQKEQRWSFITINIQYRRSMQTMHDKQLNDENKAPLSHVV